jgi:hypothetical protein
LITEQDLLEAIAECQGERNPNANTCIKLAAFLTIKNEMFGKSEHLQGTEMSLAKYSFSAGPTIEYSSDTEFSQAITGKDPATVWPVMDELMSTVQALMPRLYDGVMQRLQ